MKQNIYIICAVIISCAILAVMVVKADKKTPSEVVTAAYMAGNEGKYAKANKFFSSEYLSLIGGKNRINAGHMRRAWDRSTKEGSIEIIEILSEKVDFNRATVFFIIHYNDGSIKRRDEPLIKENGVWKITFG